MKSGWNSYFLSLKTSNCLGRSYFDLRSSAFSSSLAQLEVSRIADNSARESFISSWFHFQDLRLVVNRNWILAMKKLSLIFSVGTLAIMLFTTNSSFANSHKTGLAIPAASMKATQQNSTSLSVIVNPRFDEFVRRRPYVKYQYRSDAHARLLGLARRYLTLTELDKAITQILSSPR